jgi:acyl-CoA thioesterase YciA
MRDPPAPVFSASAQEPAMSTEPSAAAPAAATARSPAIRVMMMPKDTNALGTIFGGLILSYIDLAGAVEGHKSAQGRLVTVAMREVEFHAPVFVGDLVSFYTETLRTGNTSITVKVTVEAERAKPRGHLVTVTEAEVVYVHVDEGGRPIPVVPRP